MPSPPFDQARTVRFDLARGSVVHEGARHVLVPIDALDELAKSSAPVVTAVAELIGAAMGRRIKTKLGSPRGASLEAFANQLGGELAIAGYGTLALERWGRAMVIALEQTPLASSLVVPLLASALGTAAAQRVWCTLLSREDVAPRSERVFVASIRVLVSSEATATRVRGWLDAKIPWGEVLTRLHSGGAPA